MVETGGTDWHQSNRGVSIYISIYIFLFCLVLWLSKLLHDHPRIGSLLPEAGMVIMVGMVAGCIIHLICGTTITDNNNVVDDVAQSMLHFSPTVFFVVLLPPIIFNSGYHVHRDLFFRYITPICLYACLGTAICTVVVASILYVATLGIDDFKPSYLELLAFGSLISATDPVSTLAVFSAKRVDPHLFYLVFGESVINDAVGLVLFEALAHLVTMNNNQSLNVGQEIGQFIFDFVLGFFGSLILGSLFGLAVAMFFKHVNFRKTPILELCTYVTIMYSPFCVAEICRLSGIVTVLFTGIVARRYAECNLSPITSMNADTVFRLVAHLTETLIFLELGMSVFDLVGYGQSFQPFFVFMALVACLVGRACNIYPITCLFNLAVDDDNDGTGQENSQSPEQFVNMQSLEEDIGGGPKKEMLLEKKKTQRCANDTVVSMNTAHMLWFSGLRGAVSYALVRTFPGDNAGYFVVTTMLIVLLTTFVLGGSTEMALSYLNIPVGIDEEEYLKTIAKRKLMPGWLGRLEQNWLRPFVCRNYYSASSNGINDGGFNDVEDDAYDEMENIQEVELTERDHLELIERINRHGVYDFGQ